MFLFVWLILLSYTMNQLISILPCARHSFSGVKHAVVLASPSNEDDIKSGCSNLSIQETHRSRVKFLVHGWISLPVNKI